MTENNAIIVRPTSAMEEWQRAKEWGEYAARTGIVKNLYEGAIKAYAAYELGITAIAAANGLYIIDTGQGAKPSQSPLLVWGRILTHPEFAGYTEKRITDANGHFYGWEITMRRQKANGIVIEATRRFTVEDSTRIIYDKRESKTLADKDNYKNYGENMHYWRAMGFVEDVVWQDLNMGIKRPDELGAMTDQNGEIIDITPLSQPTVPEIEIAKQVESAIPNYGFTLTQLMEAASNEDIIAANGGGFPVTLEQVNRTVHNLVLEGKIKNDPTND